MPATPESLPPLQSDSRGFRKFPKIENLDQVRRFPLPHFIESRHIEFWWSEKLDGANLGVRITPYEWKAFARGGDYAEGLFSFAEDKQQLEPLIKAVQEWIKTECCSQINPVKEVYLWGEYYGQKINGRINYGSRTFKFYDVVISDQFADADKECMIEPKAVNFLASVWSKIGGFKQEDYFLPHHLIEANCRDDLINKLPLPLKSAYAEDDNAEGYVVTACGDSFRARWKHKDPRFEEKAKVKRNKPMATDSEVEALREQFKTYFTENRMIGIMSKTTSRDVKTLIQMLIADVKEDFLADNKEAIEMDRDRFRRAMNAGPLPYQTVLAGLERENKCN